METGKFMTYLFLLAVPCSGAQFQPCAATSSVSDVQLKLSFKDDRTAFQQGEIIPLVLSFTSTAKGRYWADVRSYDRSGRLDIEHYCVEPEVPDPLESYFRVGSFIGGGLGGDQRLSETPFTADAELNEWRSPGPGRYRIYAVSYRVWRPPDPDEKTPYGRVPVTVRSNTLELEVRSADAKWQRDTLEEALGTLASPSADDARRAARTLRFLNTRDSTVALAQQFVGLNQVQQAGWDLMLGLFGSPCRKLAIETMKTEIEKPNHAITEDFLQTLARLEITADPAWKPPNPESLKPEEWQAWWHRYQAHTNELRKQAVESALAALPKKTPAARAVTIDGIVRADADDPELVQRLRSALIAAWPYLPAHTQDDLIQYRWHLIAGPEMLPLLQKIVDEAPPPARMMPAMVRDAALKHIYELDPQLGRVLILRDLKNMRAEPGMDVIRLLPADEIAKAIPVAVNRIVYGDARELDYDLVDRYAEAEFLKSLRPAFESHLGGWACAPQADFLRYFLRVDPEYGLRQVDASLLARKSTGCYRMLLEELGDELPAAEPIAIRALDDSDTEVVQDAALALQHWGLPDAEPALWARLEKFHKEWEGREGQLRSAPDYRDPGSRGVALEQNLVYAIASGTNWICSPEKLQRLEALVWTEREHEQIEGWIRQQGEKPVLIQPTWFPEDHPTFSVLQYQALTEDQLKTKVGQFPAGTQLLWQFWKPEHISPTVTMARQEEVYEEVRAAAGKHSVVIGKANAQ